jgi:phage-related protein
MWAITNRATAAVLQEAVREERIADGIEQPRPSAINKDAVKSLSINALGQPWTVDTHNTLMTYLNIDHYLQELTD